MKLKRITIAVLTLLLLTSCWDSVELDESTMVVGVGISKEDDEYTFVIEAVAPSDISQTEESQEGKSIVLETKGKTLLDAAREIIRVAKRRLFFTHTGVWVLHHELAAEEDMLKFLDMLRREKMLRLNSYIFISEDPPIDIFSTDYTYSNILTEELITGVEYADYVSDYPSLKARGFFKGLLSPLRTAYLPTIQTTERAGKQLSQLLGSTIFNHGRNVGQ